MDRRQKKTREAIFKAFIALLSQKSYDQITVAEVITEADVGRATFYAHFETKDYLLKELCRELFDHVFTQDSKSQLFSCDTPDNTFVHLLHHLQKNDNQILNLLAGSNNELFLQYFQGSLTEFLKQHPHLFEGRKNPGLPEDFWVRHISATFVETLRWWLENGRKQTPEEVAKYFLLAV